MRRNNLIAILLLIGIGVLIGFILFTPTSGVNQPPAPQPQLPTARIVVPTAGGQAGAAPPLGRQTKVSGCVAQHGLQDLACTPGAVLPNVTAQDVCTPGYARSVRNVPESEKAAVYQAYGIQSHQPGEYEVDHLISLELGGSNEQANLWPELAEPRPGFHEKDKVEDHLHAEVCAGRMTLSAAQSLIAKDWLTVYKQLP